MRIKVEVLGPLRQYVDRPNTEWNLAEGSTLADLLSLLKLPRWAAGSPLLILVNQRLAGPQVQLTESDKVTLLLPVGGG
jgi:molybdopterin converting factor small subunit